MWKLFDSFWNAAQIGKPGTTAHALYYFWHCKVDMRKLLESFWSTAQMLNSARTSRVVQRCIWHPVGEILTLYGCFSSTALIFMHGITRIGLHSWEWWQ